VFWIYLGIALWVGLSVPFGLLAGAAIRGRRRRIIDVTEGTVAAPSVPQDAAVSKEQVSDSV
jgi:hypothetical protein